MFKKLLLPSLALATVSVAVASPITPQEALERVALEQGASGANRAPAAVGMTLTRTISTANQLPAIYLFDNGQDMLVVSADDATPDALLGYVSTASGEMPDAMQWWLSEYARQIEYMQAHPGMFLLPMGLQKSPRAEKAAIAPLCSTQWNQSSPYNYNCPTMTGGKAVTGCVATACSQVMKYFNYPEAGTGTITYSDNGTTRTLALDGKKFDWANMIDNYDATYTTTQRNAVAYLMQACGYAAHMSYSTSASGAQSGQMLAGAKKFFGYNSKAFEAMRNNYGIEDWNDLIYSNILTVGPVYLSAYNALYEGHAFVIDGYNPGGYFHVNWGWGGYYDGYFKLTALAPEGQGIGGSSGGGFDFGQGAFINFTTPTGATIDVESPSDIVQTGSLRASGSGWDLTITSSGVSSMGVAFYNSSTETGNYEWGYKYVDINTGDSDLVETEDVVEDWEANIGYRQYTLSLDLDMGTYRLYPMIRKYPDGEWKPLSHDFSAADYVTVQIGRLGIASITNVPVADFTVEDLALDSKLYWNKAFQTTFSVSNDTETELYDGLIPVIFTLSGNTPTIIAQGNSCTLDLMPGESKEITFPTQMYVTKSSFTGAAYFGLSSFSTGKLYDYFEVNVEKAPTSNTYSSTKFSFIGDASNADANNLQFACGLKCTKGYWADPMTVYIFPSAGGSALATLNSSQTYFLGVNDSAEGTVSGSFPGATANTRYEAVFGYIKSGYVNTLSSLYFTVKKEYSGIEDVADNSADNSADIFVNVDRSTGLISVEAPAEIASVELFTLDGRRLTADVTLDGTNAEAYTPTTGLILVHVSLANGVTHTAKLPL